METQARGWTAQQVADWLNLPKYTAQILAEDVTGALLFDLELGDWKELGVESGLDRKRILSKVKALEQVLAAAESAQAAAAPPTKRVKSESSSAARSFG